MMQKRIAMILLALSLSVVWMAAWAEEEPVTWTTDMLAEHYGAVVEDGLPVYSPANPHQEMALWVYDGEPIWVDDLADTRDNHNRQEIAKRLAGWAAFTDDPDQASMLLYYKERHISEGLYTGRLLVEGFSSEAGIRLLPLAGQADTPVEASVRTYLGKTITTTGFETRVYAKMPVIARDDRLNPVLRTMAAWAAPGAEVPVFIGDKTVPLDAKKLAVTGTGILDLSPLTALTQLEELDLRGKTLQNYTPLAELPALKVLYVNEDLAPDSEAIRELVRLRPDIEIIRSPLE